MDNNINFTPDNVTLSNLKRLSDLDGVNTELRIMELEDTIDNVKASVNAMIDLELGLYDILSLVSDRLSLPGPNMKDNSAGRESLLEAGYALVRDNFDRSAVAVMLSEYLDTLGYSDTDFLMGEEMSGAITYVKNVYADEAYDVLSQDIPAPRVRYSRDFSECIRLLMSGEVSYCLLPFEERGGIRLPMVEELIFKNNLKILSVTPVFGPDGTQDLKYALVSDRFNLQSFSHDDDRYLEIRIPEAVESRLSDVMNAAGLFGHSIYRVNTLSLGALRGSGQLFSIVFRADGKNFAALFTYLSLFVRDYVIIGIYKNLE